MKKILLFFTLCLTLLFAAACSGKKNADPTSTPEPTPTPVPENLAMAELEQLHSVLDTAFEQSLSKDSIDFSNGVGYDMVATVEVEPTLMSLFGLDNLESITLDLSADIAPDMQSAQLTFFLNSAELIGIDLLADADNLLLNVPQYSSQYMLSAAPGANDVGEMPSVDELTAAIPDTTEIIALLEELINDVFDSFQPKTGITEDVTISEGSYQITGDRHTVTADLDDLNAALNKFAATLKEKYPSMDVEVEEFTLENSFSLAINYYDGKNDTFAWEFYPEGQEQDAIVFLSAENGICLYSREEEGTVTNIHLRTEKESESTGTLFLPSSDGLTETETALDYSYDENSFSVSGIYDGEEFSVSYRVTETGSTSGHISFSSAGVGILMDFETDGIRNDVKLSITASGISLATVSLQTVLRDFKEIVIPENYVDEETWLAQFDMEAFTSDLAQLAEDYPALEELFSSLVGDSGEDGWTDDDWSDDDWSDDDWSDDDWGDDDWGYNEYDPGKTYQNDFMNMTGYSVDETGYVDFNPLEEEVLAMGKPSTAIYITEITDNQRRALLDLGATAFEDCYSSVHNYYFVSGYVQDSVDSCYYTEYFYSDNSSYYNSVNVYFETITDGFYSFDVVHESREEALQIACEALAILGEDCTPEFLMNHDAESLETGVWVGDFLVYFLDYGDYFLVDIY